MSAVAVDDLALVSPTPSPRWFDLAKGVLWILASLLVLSFTSASVGAIAIVASVGLILAGCDEMATGATAEGWRWAHAALGVLFLVTGFISLLMPLQTFGILALFIGWYLMAKGIFDIVAGMAFRHERPLWGVTIGVGISELLLGVWALAYPGRSAWLLIAWVAFGALGRGIGDLVKGFSGGAR